MTSLLRLKTPLELFPLEIWEAIFESLSKEELTACFRATPAWNTALLDRSALFLFPEVFKILSKRFSVNQLLSLRQICKEWKTTVDTYLQSHAKILHEEEINTTSSFWSLKEGDKNAALKNWMYKIYRFDSSHGIARFLQMGMGHMQQNVGEPVHFANPFATRYVSCLDKCLLGHPIHRQRLRAHITEFLQRFGSSIWFCKLVLEYERNCSPVEFYERVQKWMSNLESVKILHVYTAADFEGPPEIQELQAAIAQNPVVKLFHLETLKIDGLPALVVKEILAKNNHVKKLIIGDQPGHLAGQLGNCLWNTEMLQLKEFSVTCLWARALTTEAIPQSTPCWPLEKLNLSIQFSTDTEEKELRLTTLFQIVSKFGQTLRHLDIQLWCLVEEGGTNLKLDLPHLETLNIKADRFRFTSVDFLMTLKSLQKLEISVRGKAPNEILPFVARPGFIELDGFASRMYESNIWGFVNSLKEINIYENIIGLVMMELEPVEITESGTNFLYTRDEYERLRAVAPSP